MDEGFGHGGLRLNDLTTTVADAQAVVEAAPVPARALAADVVVKPVPVHVAHQGRGLGPVGMLKDQRD